MPQTKLKKLLDKRKLSAAEIGRKSGVSVRMVQKIAQGTRKPGLDVARKLARALKVSQDSLF